MTSVDAVAAPNGVARTKVLRSLADKIETQFLAEMLKTAGLGKPPETFAGGVGENQFSSFLTQEYAAATVATGGIGLSEAIFEALITKDGLK